MTQAEKEIKNKILTVKDTHTSPAKTGNAEYLSGADHEFSNYF